MAPRSPLSPPRRGAVTWASAQERMVAMIEAIGLEPVIDEVYGLEQAGRALQDLASGGHFGKLAIDFMR